jgi:UDP-glucuronate 4-epimerase
MNYEEETYDVINVGSGEPVELNEMIEAIEHSLGRSLEQRHLPEQPGDVPRTWADISRARARLGYEPEVQPQSGVEKLVSSIDL